MRNRRSSWVVLGALLLVTSTGWGQQVGSIRGVVYDRDFDAPLPLANVQIVETGTTIQATELGNYVFTDVAPGQYTLIFTKDGYARSLKSDVVVDPGRLTEVNAYLSGDFLEMEEFIVEDIQVGSGTEAALLQLRLESPALIDAISSELMSRAGASDAAGALRLVAGATVEDGKFAVIRGLPDRYVNAQLNGIRLPTADEDKRAVQLDQFPSAIIESIQVSKTFTPDQQGDASGGAVNVILKSIPEQTFFFQAKAEVSYNSQAADRNDFLSYDGGGVNFWGDDRRAPQLDRLGENWLGAAGTSTTSSPTDYKWSVAGGGKHEFDNGITVGGFGSFFYERDSAFYDDGVDNSLWVVNPGEDLVPETIQGTPGDGDFKTALFDVTKGTELVQWGALIAAGIESENHSIDATYLYTRTAEDTATLAEDTRGKEYFFPGYDPDDPADPGNEPNNRFAAPYIRTETLNYTERTTETLIFSGNHRLPVDEVGVDEVFMLREPEFDWRIASSRATLYEPDKRQFGGLWLADSLNPGFPPFVPPFIQPNEHRPFKPAANFTLGNFQRIWKDIEEESDQYAMNFKLPFEQWTGNEGYLKFGIFDDSLVRDFDQETFSNFNDNSSFEAPWEVKWSSVFPSEDHPISDGPPFVDIDYHGEQDIQAYYAMGDVPINEIVKVIGGVRWENTDLSIVNFPEEDATWFPPGAISPVALNPGDSDVAFDQNDILPSVAFVFTPIQPVMIRASYSETVARQTFKELTPIIQQEFLGGPIFIGNPDLKMSALKNYDLRVDVTPYEGTFISASWFYKDITDPIEYVQRVAGFTFTTPVNYPEGNINGWEFEVRQHLGTLWEPLNGLNVGGNMTLINSEVTLPGDEAASFEAPNILAPMPTRDLTGAPEHLYNLFLTYDFEPTGTQLGLFYTVRGDTLISGAGQSDGNFVPNVYQTEFDNLNFTLTQRLGDHVKLQFKAKNLTNPKFETEYRSDFTSDATRTSFKTGIDYSIGLNAEFTF